MTKEDILFKVDLCIEDLEMLKSGEWIPDDDSCQATLDNLTDIKEYLES